MSRVNNGIIELQINRPVYSHIERTLARRTFDANDFVVRQFSTSFREHLKTTNNKGFYTSTNGGDANKFVCQISHKKAYVKGFEIDKIGTTNLTFEKARTTAEVSNASTPVRLGNKLKINSIKALQSFKIQQIQMHSNQSSYTIEHLVVLLQSHQVQVYWFCTCKTYRQSSKRINTSK